MTATIELNEGISKPSPLGIQPTRWRLRVYNAGNPNNPSIFSNQDLIAEERGFHTAESAARHFMTRIHAWNQIKHYAIFIDEYQEAPSNG